MKHGLAEAWLFTWVYTRTNRTWHYYSKHAPTQTSLTSVLLNETKKQNGSTKGGTNSFSIGLVQVYLPSGKVKRLITIMSMIPEKSLLIKTYKRDQERNVRDKVLTFCTVLLISVFMATYMCLTVYGLRVLGLRH